MPSGVVHAHFKLRWDTAVEFGSLVNFSLHAEADNTIFGALITEKEIEKNVGEICKTSPPGPDGITLGHLIKKRS